MCVKRYLTLTDPCVTHYNKIFPATSRQIDRPMVGGTSSHKCLSLHFWREKQPAESKASTESSHPPSMAEMFRVGPTWVDHWRKVSPDWLCVWVFYQHVHFTPAGDYTWNKCFILATWGQQKQSHHWWIIAFFSPFFFLSFFLCFFFFLTCPAVMEQHYCSFGVTFQTTGWRSVQY